MIKKISFIFLICCLLASCGKKGDPKYQDSKQKIEKLINKNKVNGTVKLKLYKGNITIISRQTKSSAYSLKKVSFEENKSFNKSNVERFINFHKKKLRS